MLTLTAVTCSYVARRVPSHRRSSPVAAVEPLPTYRFPDGSSYRGGVEDGAQHGQGEWRSAEGDVYVGGFSRGVYEGHGRHADDRGNVYEGEFRAGAFDGVGTFTHADGRTECNRYAGGREVGEGVRWSANRARAWRLRDGLADSEVDIAAAAAIASELGLGVPQFGDRASVFAPSPDGEARLRRRLTLLGEHAEGRCEGGGESGDGDSERRGEGGAFDALSFETHVGVDSCDGVMSRGGALIAHSTRPLVSAEECERIIDECEARAAWSSARHPDECYATTDQPVHQLEQTAAWLRESLLPDAALPFLAHAFGFALRSAERDGAGAGGGGNDDGVGLDAQEAWAALRVSDAFVVKYNASAGQRLMAPHRDGAVFSFNVALNDLDEYDGGGTYFRMLDRNATGAATDAATDAAGGCVGSSGALRSPKGHIVAHSSALMHGGHPTTRGVRYLLVAFCTIAPEYAGWASRFYEHVSERVDPGDEQAFAPRALPHGMLTAGPIYRQARQASLEGDRA